MTIALIKIPHQHRPSIDWYDNPSDLIETAQDCAALDDDEGPTTFDDAVHYLTKDINAFIVVQSETHRHPVRKYNGHKITHIWTMLPPLMARFTPDKAKSNAPQ